MKHSFLYKKIYGALFVGLICLQLNTYAGLFGAEVTLDGKKLTEAIDAVLEKRIAQLQSSTAEVLDRSQTSFAAKFEYYYPQIKKDIGLTLNEVRLVPVYAVGTTCMIASINMYWQALNDYLNSTETEPEAVQAAHKKIFRKIKAGLVFSALGVATMYKSHALAQLFTGYTPEP